MKPKSQPNFLQRVWSNVQPAFLAKNTIGSNLSGLPLFNRAGPRMHSSELQAMVEMADRDYYKGYLYSAIRNRANRTAQLATDHLETQWSNAKGELDQENTAEHPYLAKLSDSPSFTDYFFWSAMSTFLDLRGLGFIFALRNFEGEKYGEVKEFKLLNPYSVSRIVDPLTGLVRTYTETRGGMYRELPLEQVIEVRTLNPFNLNDGFPMAEAAKDDQYLNTQAGVYTRSAIRNNVGQRGLLTTDVMMDDKEFENFRAQVEVSGGPAGAGRFMYGNGPGALTYTDMQIDLDKLALDKINEISRERLFAVSGTSKTLQGIEQSGVTRDSGQMQSDLFMQGQSIPQLQTIIDALNQDYRNHYPSEFAKGRPNIIIDNPLKTDHEAEKVDAEVVKLKAEAAKILIETGFEASESLVFVGIDEELTFEGRQPVKAEPVQEHRHDHIETHDITPGLAPIVAGKQSSLEIDVQNIQRRILMASLKKLDKNALDSADEAEVITKSDKKEYVKELSAVLAAFYGTVLPLFAQQTIKQRIREFQLVGDFSVDAVVRKFITERAGQSALSHVDTVLAEIHKVAKDLAASGAGRAEIVSKLTKQYNDVISRTQATRLARTETNRTVAQAQYEADRQFIGQNKLEAKAFKRWITRSSNPCSYCVAMSEQSPIPFHDNFLDLGAHITAKFDTSEGTVSRSFVAGYEPISSGTMHPSCACIYELIIKTT